MRPLIDFFSQHRRLLKPHSRILLACSGGPDSVALVHAMKAIQKSLQIDIEIAHVNHMLRGKESERDERFVRTLARTLGLRCHVVRRPMKSLRRGNLEEAARDKRYAALSVLAKRRRCAAVFTAHTLDDQAETILMNLMRGSGPDGLAGMSAIRLLENSRVWLCRPLLDTSKKELLSILVRSRLQFRIDSSNRNKDFVRNWLRRSLLPSIEKKFPGFQRRLRNLGLMVLDEKLYWDGKIAELEGVLLKPYRQGRLLDLGGLLRYPPAVQRRFLRRSLGRDVLTFDAVERLRQWMRSAPTGGRLWQLRKGWVVERLSRTKGSPSARLFWFKHSDQRKDKYLA